VYFLAPKAMILCKISWNIIEANGWEEERKWKWINLKEFSKYIYIWYCNWWLTILNVFLLSNQPKEITDIKKFMKLWGTNKDAPAAASSGVKKVVYVKSGKKITKFKIRGKKYLYTFKTADAKIAKGIRDAIPPGKIFWKQ